MKDVKASSLVEKTVFGFPVKNKGYTLVNKEVNNFYDMELYALRLKKIRQNTLITSSSIQIFSNR